jgi:hypothetical protein
MMTSGARIISLNRLTALLRDTSRWPGVASAEAAPARTSVIPLILLGLFPLCRDGGGRVIARHAGLLADGMIAAYVL